MLKWMAAGAGILVVLALLAAYAALMFGLVPANADAQPSALEHWAARTSLNATVDRDATTKPNPLLLDDANLNAGIKSYATNCMVCHGASDGKPSNIAHGLYQHAPQLGDRGVEREPEGETYWKVQHGIRLTGMPSFGAALTDKQIWQVVMFLKHMDALPPGPDAKWKKQPSQAQVDNRIHP
jgi:thiosulfate dehydrogenase